MAFDLRIPCAALVATLVTGCAVHWDVETYAVPDANVASRQTYFWKGGDFASASEIEPAAVAAAESQVRSAVTEELSR